VTCYSSYGCASSSHRGSYFTAVLLKAHRVALVEPVAYPKDSVTWVSDSIAHQAWQVFEQFNVDKLWSFTDCVSYVVMQSQGITEVFSFDRHFSQMGFIRHP